MLVIFKDAEKGGYTPEDLQSALNHCKDSDPVKWLNENWVNMIDTVVTLVSIDSLILIKMHL